MRRLLPEKSLPYLAGPDPERLSLLHEAFADPKVRAVFAARGGFGATRLLEGIDRRAVAGSGKPLIGFSDVTALHLLLFGSGRRSIHGPVVTRLGEEDPVSLDRLFSLLERSEAPEALGGRKVAGGDARGRLVGGCLSLLVALLGTPYFPDLSGCILFLEDVGERPYRIDRLLTQLRQAGKLEGLAGIVLGEFAGCDDGELRGSRVAEELLAGLGLPLLADLPVGHGDRNLALPHGALASIEGDELCFLEGVW